ncbi:hypothetical protein COLO4_29935 [Corchorus olitorius]|uniref:Uncharacterized protein n=1 Tax=Corchorus olitorius TaxID=93759 RepID=A0A1R3HCG7_9ROSI|nr:hypothetical protein COLO4_29935 [Corchorus olitorius]
MVCSGLLKSIDRRSCPYLLDEFNRRINQRRARQALHIEVHIEVSEGRASVSCWKDREVFESLKVGDRVGAGVLVHLSAMLEYLAAELANIMGRFEWLTCPRKDLSTGWLLFIGVVPLVVKNQNGIMDNGPVDSSNSPSAKAPEVQPPAATNSGPDNSTHDAPSKLSSWAKNLKIP